MNIYKECPVLQDDKFVLRPVESGDLTDLLKVYSDIKSVPLFNSDNCHGDDFYYTTVEKMKQALDFWREAYQNGWFVRLAIVDKCTNKAVGTIEEFHRDSEDFFNNCGLLRLDLLSDYERSREIKDIVSLISVPSFELFGCNMIATKAIAAATERIEALQSLGFEKSREPLIGHDGTKYYDYYILKKTR